MDLRHILNPLPDPDPRPRNNTNHSHSGENQSIEHSQLPTSSYLHSKFFLSPRRLDPETASVSTNSSTKRRRTNRGKGSPDRAKQLQSTAMGRSFSELEVPSDTSSLNDEDNDAVKRGVAQLSLQGALHLPTDLRIDAYTSLQLGTRVEALKPGTQGTWYVARIVESASFPAHYIDGDEAQEVPSVWYPMVCVHYEGEVLNLLRLIFRIFAAAVCVDTTILTAVDVRRSRYDPS